MHRARGLGAQKAEVLHSTQHFSKQLHKTQSKCSGWFATSVGSLEIPFSSPAKFNVYTFVGARPSAAAAPLLTVLDY